jgi:pimeloyl-ACP methyl ester carboxylesterase
VEAASTPPEGAPADASPDSSLIEAAPPAALAEHVAAPASLAPPRVREGYARTPDGASIYYRASGQGLQPIVLCDGLGCDGFIWKYLAPHLEASFDVVRWHYRGHGRSPKPRDMSRMTVEQLADDLTVVLDEVGLERAAVAGHSLGVQVLLEFYRRHRRATALLPICGAYGRVLDTFREGSPLAGMIPGIFRMLSAPLGNVLWKTALLNRFSFKVATLLEINGNLIHRDDFVPYLDHMASMDPAVFASLLGSAAAHSAEDMLPTVEVPTLIVAGARDSFTPSWISEKMWKHIPGAELLVIPLGSHTAPLEIPELVNLRVEKFLRAL